MFSSASMTVSDVTTGSGYYRCFFDLKGGSVMNQFAMDDMAYCQRFDPENSSIIKYYWRKVVGIGENYIDISDVLGEYDGSDIPEIGDNIVQLGNRTNTDRQAVFVIDQLGGGRCTQYAGIGADPSPFYMADKDFIVFGYDPSTGRAFQTIYGDTYIGARDESTWYKWDTSTGKMTIKGGLVINPAGTEFPIGLYRGVYSAATTYYKGDKVTYGGSSWIYINDVPEAGHTPEVGLYWAVDSAKGDSGADGAGVEFIFTRNNTGATPATPDSIINQDDYVPDGWTDNQQGVTSTLQYEFVSKRTGSTLNWGAFSTPKVWAKYSFDGADGQNGTDGTDYEFIFKRTTTSTTPETPATAQQDDYIPTGWTDNMTGVTSTYVYEWVSKRTKTAGVWSAFSTPALWSKYSFDGSDGSGGEDAPYYEYQYAKNGSNVVAPLFTATDLNPSGWDVSIPALNPLEYAWRIVAQKAPDGLSLVENWALVGIDKKYHGSSAGPTIHREGDYASGTSYSGSSTDVDAVWYGGVAYITRVDAGVIPTGTAPTNTTYWNTFGVSADSMATDVFLARQITADEIDFTNATGTNVDLTGKIVAEAGGKIADFDIISHAPTAGSALKADSIQTYIMVRNTDDFTAAIGSVAISNAAPVVLAEFSGQAFAEGFFRHNSAGSILNMAVYAENTNTDYGYAAYLKGRLKVTNNAIIKGTLTADGLITGSINGMLSAKRVSDASYNLGISDCWVTFTGTNPTANLPTTADAGRVKDKFYMLRCTSGGTFTVPAGSSIIWLNGSLVPSLSIGNSDLWFIIFDGTYWQACYMWR